LAKFKDFPMKCCFAILFTAIACISTLAGQEELPVNPPIQPFSAEEMALPTPSFELPRKSALISVGLSYLFPGLGHVYLGDMKTASSLAGTTCAGVGVASLYNFDKSAFITGIMTIQTAWSYGIYAAYRDVRFYNGTAGYSYKMPTDSFEDLAFAPFRWSILKKPEVWGGFLGAFALAACTSLAYPHDADARIHSSLSMDLMNSSPLIAFPVAIGEESFFRGFLQSQLAENLNPWAGIGLSSLAFGAAHIPNAFLLKPENRWRYYTFSLPLITAFGTYFGWLTHKNRSLQESVALHTWYDFILFAASSLATQAACTNESRGKSFAMTMSF
jgi:membrane protease YdiL (CAAX protease family)